MLLSHYTFFNFKNFIQYISLLYNEVNEVIKYFELYQDSTVFIKNLLLLDNF